MRKILLMLTAFLMGASLAIAQERSVSGKVTSSEDGSTLPGVNVVVKGTTNGTVTDSDGKFALSVSTGSTVIISFIGYVTQEIAIGERSTIDVQLASDITQLSEVVVTALGVEKSPRELGFGVTGVKSEELTNARESNILNALQGKVTGMFINQSSGNLGGSTKVVIRGVTSLSGRNNPLWVVDGIPINNEQDVSGSRIQGGRDFANGASVINPDDVASMTVLKGAAASALYGSRAAAGVIIVTTKKGKASGSGGPTVTLNSSLRFDDLFRVPDYQNEYSQGSFGKYDSSSFNNWGAKIAGQMVTESITGNKVPLTAYPDNYKDFYRIGKTVINNVAVSDGNDKVDYRVSATTLNQTGILPNANLDRLTLSFNVGMKHSAKLKSRFSAQYINTSSKGTGVAGANDPNIIGAQAFPRSLNFKNYLPWIDAQGNQIGTVNPFTNNPFWIRHENRSERKDNRFIGSVETTFSPIQNLSFTARAGLDFDKDDRLLSNRVGTVQRATGDFTVDGITRTQVNVDILGTHFLKINENLQLRSLAGFNYNKRGFIQESVLSTGLSIPELFNPANALTNQATRGFSEQVLMGAYGEAALTYKEWATLTITGRNDWTSTLPKESRSYFYPSTTLAFVFTDALGIKSNVLSFGKIRASFAQVGNDTNPYQLDFNYFPQSQAAGQYNLNQVFPFNGRLGYSASSTIPPVGLKPQQQTSYEAGTELEFFSGKIRLDVSYFRSLNVNQILSVPIPESTGFAAQVQNVGKIRTEGVEVTLSADVIKKNQFTWTSTVNFTHNVSIVEELTAGLPRVLIASEFNGIQIMAEVGKQFQIYAIPYLRDPASNRPVINPLNGLRQGAPSTSLGTVFPDFIAGFVNTVSYKNFRLTATVDGRFGGIMSSSTVAALRSSGSVKETLPNREGAFLDTQGVLLNADGVTYRDNDVPVRSAEVFWGNVGVNLAAEGNIFDASFAKLREVALSYTFPRSMFGKGLKGLQIGVEGRNLALLYAKVPHIDPEANLFGSGADGFGSERATVPSTRSAGFNIKLTF